MKKIIIFSLTALLLAGCGSSGNMQRKKDPVNIGYGTVDEDKRVTAVSSLKVDRNAVQTYSSIYDYLRGRVPGVMVSTDNRIIIRGVGTNTDQTDPLILVDGVATTDISGINPMDVESVDVIKDGSSSIYGMQGANGVILITTKH